MPPTHPITILDGGISRELIRISAPFQQPEWSAYALLEAPSTVHQIHAEFVQCGADIITTNSYALVPFHIGEARFRDRGEELAALAGKLARQAADEASVGGGRRVRVAGSLPPVFGSYRPNLFDAATVQGYLAVLVRGLAPYVDVWLGETLSLIGEAQAVKEAVSATGKPFWISFTIHDREEGGVPRLRGGESVTAVVEWVVASGAEAVCFNCSRPEFMAAAVRDAKAVVQRAGSTVQIGVYANAFVQNSESYAANEDVSDTRDDLDAAKYAALAKEWIDAGANIVGGCCGIGCAHIRRLVQEVRSHP